MKGSFYSDAEEDEIILNEETLCPEYSQTKDTAPYDEYQLKGTMCNFRGKLDECRKCNASRLTKKYGIAHGCKLESICSVCKECVPRA